MNEVLELIWYLSTEKLNYIFVLNLRVYNVGFLHNHLK